MFDIIWYLDIRFNQILEYLVEPNIRTLIAESGHLHDCLTSLVAKPWVNTVWYAVLNRRWPLDILQLPPIG